MRALLPGITILTCSVVFTNCTDGPTSSQVNPLGVNPDTTLVITLDAGSDTVLSLAALVFSPVTEDLSTVSWGYSGQVMPLLW